MSNRIVPATYRAVIDDVMANIRQDFADFGVDDEVLAELQNKWEQKVVESNVADFEPPQPQAAAPAQPPLHPQPLPPSHVQLNLPVPQRMPSYPSGSPAPLSHYTQVKSEPHDTSYVLPPLPGPGPPPGMHQLLLPGGQRPLSGQPLTQQQVQQVMHHQAHLQQFVHQQHQQHQVKPNISSPAPTRVPQVDGPSGLPALVPTLSKGKQKTIPQLDGPSSVSSSSSSRSSGSPPPQISHPGPSTSTLATAVTAAADTEEIGSDLDDDDSEGEDDEITAANGDGTTGDIVYCTYDKVQRVKNKWKCVLKDGIISVNGKDYLFSKCAGEFEW